MSVSWKAWSDLSCLCLFLCATGALSQEFQLQPPNLTVLQGSHVKFNATVDGIWEFITWTVRGLLVLTVPVTNINISSGQFSAGSCSGDDTSCVEFTIHNVTREEAGPVVCTVQGDYGSKMAQLYVQESGAVSIVGGNVTVVQDQQVEFQCETSAWYPIPTITWTRNGEVVNSSLYNTTADGDSFNSTSVLKFQAVSDATVECSARVSELKIPQSSSVLLVVVPKPPDWTVLIAVVVSIGSAALLVLLILGIIFCYKRRKEKQPNYQDEISKRVRTQSQTSAAGQREGQVNAGYLPEGQTSKSGVAPSELADSGIFEAHDVVNSGHAGNGNNNTMDASGLKKHRHVTIV